MESTLATKLAIHCQCLKLYSYKVQSWRLVRLSSDIIKLRLSASMSARTALNCSIKHNAKREVPYTCIDWYR